MIKQPLGPGPRMIMVPVCVCDAAVDDGGDDRQSELEGRLEAAQLRDQLARVHWNARAGGNPSARRMMTHTDRAVIPGGDGRGARARLSSAGWVARRRLTRWQVCRPDAALMPDASDWATSHQTRRRPHDHGYQVQHSMGL